VFKSIRSILSNRKALQDVGLLPIGIQAVRGLPLVTWDVLEIGTPVQLIAHKVAPWRFIAKGGDTGVIELLIQGSSNKAALSDDLYKVRLDSPKRADKPVVYATLSELGLRE